MFTLIFQLIFLTVLSGLVNFNHLRIHFSEQPGKLVLMPDDKNILFGFR